MVYIHPGGVRTDIAFFYFDKVSFMKHPNGPELKTQDQLYCTIELILSDWRDIYAGTTENRKKWPCLDAGSVSAQTDC